MSSIFNFQDTLYTVYPNKDLTTDTTSKLFTIKSSDEGSTWFSPTAISDNASDVKYLNSKSAFFNNVHIAYAETIDYSGDTYHLSYIKGYLDNSDTLQYVEQPILEDQEIEIKHVDMDVTRELAHIVWEQDFEIYYLNTDNTNEESSIEFSALETPVSENVSKKFPRIVSDSDKNLYLFYVAGSDLKFIKYNAAFLSWSQSFTIATDVSSQSGSISISAAVSPKDDSLYVIYVATDGTVKTSFSLSQGLRWSLPVNVFTDDQDYAPVLYSDCDGNITAMAGIKSTTSPRLEDKIVHRYSTDRGISWGEESDVERFFGGEFIDEAEEIIPYAVSDVKGGLNVTYQEERIKDVVEENNVIFFKTVDGIFESYQEIPIPRISIDPTFLNKSANRHLTQPNIITDSNDQMFIYEYDSIFRQVVEKKSTDFGNTWSNEVKQFDADDDLRFLRVVTDGNTKWAFYQLDAQGVGKIYVRSLAGGASEWSEQTEIFPTNLPVASNSISGTKERTFEVVEKDGYFIFALYYFGEYEEFENRILVAMLDENYDVIDSDDSAESTNDDGTMFESGIGLDYYNRGSEQIGAAISFMDYRDFGSPALFRPRIRTRVFYNVDLGTSLGSDQTRTIDDNWDGDSVHTPEYLMSPTIITDKSVENPRINVVYCKTTSSPENNLPEQLVYWGTIGVDRVVSTAPIVIIKSNLNINSEQLYLSEVTGISSDSIVDGSDITTTIHVTGVGKHISTLGTNFAAWYVIAEEFHSDETTKRISDKSIRSESTSIDVINEETVTMVKDSQESIHTVVSQFDINSTSNSIYTKRIVEDESEYDSLTILGTPIGSIIIEPE